MSVTSIQFASTTSRAVRFGAEPPKKTTELSEPETKAVKAEMPYTAADFNQQFRGYITHLDAMGPEDLKKSAQWLVKLNAYLISDKTGEHIQKLPNREFVTYLAIANFFARAEQKPLLESTLKETLGLWKRNRYRKNLDLLGFLAGESHEYRKKTHQLRQANPAQAKLSWGAFLTGEIPHDEPMSFPIRYENPQG